MFFNILATFAEFESDMIPRRTRESMEIARDTGNLRDKVPDMFHLQHCCEKTAAMLLWALLASGQFQIGKVDVRETLSWSIEPMPLDLPA